jgi:hypothetical protein
MYEAHRRSSPNSCLADSSTGLLRWIERVSQGVSEINRRYPFLAYGTDWLAFAHSEALYRF